MHAPIRHEAEAVCKKRFSWTDTYGVEAADGQDDVLLPAGTVVIDRACHDRHDDLTFRALARRVSDA